MGKFGDKIAGIKQGIVTDANFSRAGRGIVRGAKALPSASGRYLLQKVPIVQWIPKYAPQWIVNDFIAGVTVGIVLIPQALVFSLVTGASPSVGLVSTLVPPVIYVFMGTSKDISTGPTGTSAFATSSIVALLAENKVPAFLTVPTATFTTGILSLIFGTLKLGFLLDFLSIPVLNGFMMGQALVALFQQIPLILGEQGVSPSFAQGSMQVATKILTSQPLTIAIGLPAVAFLLLLQFLGKKFGPRFALVRVIAHVRSLVVLVAFTAISFFVNKDLEKPVWAIIGDVPKLTITPSAPFAPLIGPLIALSIPVFLSAALEHLALARAFGRINGYEIDASQELVYLGVANMVNGVMGGMPVGGNIQRSAVNNASGVKTPLAGLFTSMFLLLALTQLTTVLAFMPTATLAAVLFVAILEVNPPQDIIGKYWKMSFAEFIATIISFNFALVATSEIGVAAAVVYSIFYALFRIMFSHPKPVTKADLENTYGKDPSPLSQPNHIPSGTQIMTLSQHLMFLNAYRMKRSIMNQVQTHFSGVPNERKNSNRVWSDFREKEILRMRRKAEVMTPTRFIPHLDCLILDFTHTTYIDVSGITMLQELRSELHAWAGDGFELRFVGLCPDVMTRFKRSMWQLVDRDTAIQGVTKDTDIYFELLKPAIEAMPRRIKEDEELDFGLSKPLTHNSMVGSYDEYEKYDMQDGQQPVISTSVYTRDGRAYNRNSE